MKPRPPITYGITRRRFVLTLGGGALGTLFALPRPVRARVPAPSLASARRFRLRIKKLKRADLYAEHDWAG